MPRVQFVNQHESVRITKDMPHPQTSNVTKWFRMARKAIPDIPDIKQGLWHIFHQEVNSEYLRFELRSREDTKCHVIIFTKMGNFGDTK